MGRISQGNKPMKLAADRPYADPERAARKLIEIASTIEPVQDGRRLRYRQVLIPCLEESDARFCRDSFPRRLPFIWKW